MRRADTVATFSIRRDVQAPVDLVWRALTDWPAHGRWVALTTVQVTSPGPGGVGTTFVARTGLGPIGFDDPMTVTEWRPPRQDRAGRCTVVKRGRVVLGEATFDVTAHGGQCTVEWVERAEIVGIRRLPGARTASRVIGKVVFSRVLARMAREVERVAASQRTAQERVAQPRADEAGRSGTGSG
ncbi:MAG: SRPBCC family protein [Angustibacter sp.]